MEVLLCDAAELLRRGQAFLAQREAQHNLLLALLPTVARDPHLYGTPAARGALVLRANQVEALLLQTPPRAILLSACSCSAAVASALAAHEECATWIRSAPGLSGEPVFARRIAEALARPYTLTAPQHIYAMTQCITPEPSTTLHVREASVEADVSTVEALLRAFDRRFGPEPVMRAWSAGERRMFVGSEAPSGQVCCLVGSQGPRVSAVYTAPSHRRRGYASHLTAHVCRVLLVEGKRELYLYAEAANTTAVGVYRRLGFELISRVVELQWDEPRLDGVLVSCCDLEANLAFFVNQQGFRLRAVWPADNPRIYVVERQGTTVRLQHAETNVPVQLFVRGAPGGLSPNGTCVRGSGAALGAPVSRPVGRAGMRYERLAGGRLGASRIVVPDGAVADYTHFHAVQFQCIYVVHGWVRVVYEGQGEAFVMRAGDCVVQAPRMRHRVLEAGDNLCVIEVSTPDEHPTYPDDVMELPTREQYPVSGYHFASPLQELLVEDVARLWISNDPPAAEETSFYCAPFAVKLQW